jgi:hypothetical protein
MKLHRNVIKNRFCKNCDHSHFPVEQENALGICVLDPPTPFIVGMSAPAIVSKPGSGDTMPLVRSFYPPVALEETCSHWTPVIEGET